MSFLFISVFYLFRTYYLLNPNNVFLCCYIPTESFFTAWCNWFRKNSPRHLNYWGTTVAMFWEDYHLTFQTTTSPQNYYLHSNCSRHLWKTWKRQHHGGLVYTPHLVICTPTCTSEQYNYRMSLGPVASSLLTGRLTHTSPVHPVLVARPWNGC